VLAEIMAGTVGEAQTAAFLIAMRTKGETVEELTGLARAMRRLAVPVEAGGGDLLDTAGTGGGISTFNVSTTAALVAAGAGCRVAKHGNRSATSLCGSADLLEALGARIDLDAAAVAQCVDEVGFGFMFAPAHHPGFRHAAPVRRELATRTVFNVLGPLTNPAGARAQVIGVYAPELVRTIAEVALRLGAGRAYVVHGHGGIDELSPAGPSLVAEVVDAGVREWVLEPEQLGLERVPAESLRGGTPAENAQAIREVFAGGDGGHRAAVLLNAAGAIAAAGHADDLREGLEVARRAVDSGAAAARLDELARFTQEAHAAV
jgi:anthranilate phosphoribosyltransferase